jgi:hypothetical protein
LQYTQKSSGHTHQSQSTANIGLQNNPTDGVVLIKQNLNNFGIRLSC